jgi:hypothetical protein
LGQKNQKPSRGGSVLASETRVGLFWGRGDPIGAGYARVEVLGGRGPRLWSPCSWSPPFLCSPLVRRCPLPLTSPDPQLTYFSFVRPHPLSVCARSRSFDLMCLRFVPIHARSTSHALGLCPFALVCACCCSSRCAYARPRAGPWFVCACPARVSSVCSTLPVKAKLVFLRKKLYLPFHLRLKIPIKQMNS